MMREHERGWERDEMEETRDRRGFLEKVLNFLGFSADEAEIAEEELEEPSEPVKKGRPQVVSLQNAQRQLKLVVFEPKTFEEVQTIIDQLKNRRPVIINLDETDKSISRRVVDFMSGAVYALGGGMQKISLTIFLFTPPNVEISLGPRAEPRDRTGFFNM